MKVKQVEIIKRRKLEFMTGSHAVPFLPLEYRRRFPTANPPCEDRPQSESTPRPKWSRVNRKSVRPRRLRTGGRNVTFQDFLDELLNLRWVEQLPGRTGG